MGSMGLSCGSQFAKYFLFVFNVVFWLVGAAIFGVGIWVLADDQALKLLHVATIDSSDTLVKGAAVTFIIAGVIIFLTGFLGCCGAIRESPCMLMTYAAIVGFVLFLQVVAGIMGAVFKDKIEDKLGESMVTSITEKYGQPGQSALTEGYDFMQRYFECCGAVDGVDDWQDSRWYNATEQPVPTSCCVLKNRGDYNADPVPVNTTLCLDLEKDYVHTSACKPKLEDWVKGHAGILIGVAFGLAFVQVMGIIFACCLSKRIKSLYEYV